MLRYALPLLAGLMSVTAAPLSIHGIEQSCGFQKAYGLLVKVLLVYGSHALTVKGRAGSKFWDDFCAGLSALLCPGFASQRAFIDLCMAFRADGVKGCVNTESACFRVKRGDYPELEGSEVAKGAVINTRALLGEDELLLMIPRGQHALFYIEKQEHLFEHGAQLKAFLGIIQLAFGIIQLVETSGALVNRYGTGCYVFTIIPYALASLINGLAAIFTPQYSEIQELHLKDDVGKDAVIEAFSLDNSFNSFLMVILNSGLQLVTYLAIMVVMTGFRKRESTIAQRGWLISWVLIGIASGAALGLLEASIRMKPIEREGIKGILKALIRTKGIKWILKPLIHTKLIEGKAKGDVIEGERKNKAIEGKAKDKVIERKPIIERKPKLVMVFVAIFYGVPTVGGLVILSQQYLTNFICTN